jgi:mono/diheme cytochrome c family protein
VADADGAFASLGKFSEPTGELMYKRVCAGCHMPDALGAKGAGMYPALAKNKNLASASYPLYIILHGKNGMPAVGKMMTDQQAADVVNYVRSNFGNKYKDKVTAADAKAVR